MKFKKVLNESSEEDKVEKIIKSKNYEQMSDIEMISYIYNGELRNGVHYDNYKYNKGDKVLVYDAWVNAKDKYSALNKLRRKLGFGILSKEELDSDIEDGYCIVEESNYYDEEHNVTYQWYVSYDDVELSWLKKESLNERVSNYSQLQKVNKNQPYERYWFAKTFKNEKSKEPEIHKVALQLQTDDINIVDEVLKEIIPYNYDRIRIFGSTNNLNNLKKDGYQLLTLNENLKIVSDENNFDNNIKKENIVVDIYYDRHERMYAVCLKDKNTGNILSDYSYVFTKKEAEILKQDMLEDPQSFIYDIYELNENLEDYSHISFKQLQEIAKKKGWELTKYTEKGLNKPQYYLDGEEMSLKLIKYILTHSDNVGKNESLNESQDLKKSTAYMLRNDGKLFECKSYHPYIVERGKNNLIRKTKNKEFLINYLFDDIQGYEDLKWFYNNTNQQEIKNKIQQVIQSLIQMKYFENKELWVSEDEVKKDFNINSSIFYTDKIENIYSDIELINNLTNQEFCRIRTSDMFLGGNSNDIYFRISSIGFNWFNLIWDIINKFNIDTITIVKDYIGQDKEEFYKIKGQVIDHISKNNFLTLPGNPIIENIDKNWQEEMHKINENYIINLVNNRHSEHTNSYFNWYRNSGMLQEDLNNLLTEVYPHKGESKKDFTKRFMSVTKDEYPDIKQRYAVCMSYWSRRNKKRKNESLDEDFNLKDCIVDYVPKYSTYILKNGKFLDLAEGTHGAFQMFCDEENINIKKEIPDFYNSSIKCNDGKNPFEQMDYAYIEIHKQPTTVQYYSLLEWFDHLDKDDTVEIDIYDNNKLNTKTYSLEEYTSDEIIKKIKRYYASGTLYEHKNN